jgi:hypothetical protein
MTWKLDCHDSKNTFFAERLSRVMMAATGNVECGGSNSWRPNANEQP